MKKLYRFESYSDPGHGWLKVRRTVIHWLGIEYSISHCSYQRGAFVYLEEDCDLSRFIAAFEARTGISWKSFLAKHVNANRSSRIRTYESYRVQA